MIHEIEVNINLKITGLSSEQLFKITDKLARQMNSTNGKINFDELNEIFIIVERPYHISNIEFPVLNNNNFVAVKTTKIDIVG